MYIPDLELCRYRAPFDATAWHAPLLAIGWLDHPHPFVRGFAPHGLFADLERFIDGAQVHFEQYHSRGLHLCSLCERQSGDAKLIPFGFFNVLVPGAEVIYAAPAAILHYVKAHHYLPPDSFIEAVRKCPPYGSDEYMAALRQANRGETPPIQRYEDVVQAFRDALIATAAAREAAALRNIPDASQQELLVDVRRAERLEDDGQLLPPPTKKGRIRNSG